jgi:D-mannonate dehydratase
MIQNVAQVGISAVKYNLTLLGVVRTEATPGRGGALYSTFRYDQAALDCLRRWRHDRGSRSGRRGSSGL